MKINLSHGENEMVRKLKVTNFLNSENSDDFLEMAYNAETK